MKAEILKKEIIYKGFFRLSRLTIEHNLYQGGKAKVVRELLERGHAVAVLLYDAHQDRVVLVEQFRVGVLEDENSWLLEVVAGMIEEGEEPASADHPEEPEATKDPVEETLEEAQEDAEIHDEVEDIEEKLEVVEESEDTQEDPTPSVEEIKEDEEDEVEEEQEEVLEDNK